MTWFRKTSPILRLSALFLFLLVWAPSCLSQPHSPIPPPIDCTAGQTATLFVTGDIMMHGSQIAAGYNLKEKTYHFDDFFTEVAPIFQTGDWVVGNLETTLTGEDQFYTGYPCFNAPEQLAEALLRAGFTILTTSNNHSLDREGLGVERTIDHLDALGLEHTGTSLSGDARNQPLLVKRKGITLGLIAYTYGTNGIPLPKGRPWMVNLIDFNLIAADIKTTREAGADIVAVSLHFGAEYQRSPNQEQRGLVDHCFAHGADLVLGSHPHVLQPVEWRTWTDASGREGRGFVIYSLGNFVSGQRDRYTDLGAILKITLCKPPGGRAVVADAEVIPTFVYRSWGVEGHWNYKVYPLEKAAERASEKGANFTPEQKSRIREYIKMIGKFMAGI